MYKKVKRIAEIAQKHKDSITEYVTGQIVPKDMGEEELKEIEEGKDFIKIGNQINTQEAKGNTKKKKK